MAEAIELLEQQTLSNIQEVTHRTEYEILSCLANYYEAHLKYFEKCSQLIQQSLPHLKNAAETGNQEIES